MPENPGRLLGPLRQVWRRFKKELIDEVPEDSALCEFDCRKEQCRYDEWASCERRLSRAAGELMPPARPAPPPPPEEK